MQLKMDMPEEDHYLQHIKKRELPQLGTSTTPRILITNELTFKVMKKNSQLETRKKKLPAKEQPRPPRQLPVKVLGVLKVLILPLLCCLSLLSNAVPTRDSTGIKDYTIKGKVADERGEPMPG